MRVLQTIASMSASAGGPSTCTHDLLDALYKIKPGIDLITVKTANVVPLGNGEKWLHTVPDDITKPLAFSKNFNKALLNSNYDIYHCNGLWMGINHSTCAIARKKRKPYIISPHGMLYPTALRRNYWKKWLLLNLWYKTDINKASCIHATCKQEAVFIKDFGYKGPIAIIPNPVHIPDDVTPSQNKPLINGKKTIGFLGRLHPIKKIENVLYAMKQLSYEELEQISFQIIGSYDKKYEEWLNNEVIKLNLQQNVEFLGFITGHKKYQLLQNIWALMVPSEQENFGMIVPEALISGTPVYASTGTPWNELNESECGWWYENSIENITQILREIIKMPESKCIEMGQKGRQMIEAKYRDDIVAQKMLNLYDWINQGGIAPEFVKL